MCVLETKVDALEDRVDNLGEIKSAVIELTLLSRQQLEYNKKFTETHEQLLVSNAKLGVILNSINDSLTNMNEELKCTNERVNEFENKVDIKFDKVDVQFDGLENKSKIDLLDIIKKPVATLLLGGLTFWILQLVGIIKL